MLSDSNNIRLPQIDQVETPCFVIRAGLLDSLAYGLQNALQHDFPDGIAGYSIKTNNLPWIISHMKNLGYWAEAVSSDEYHLAKKLGFPIEKIILNGPAKRKAEFIEAVENGAIVNLDSKREIDWLRESGAGTNPISKVGLRVNFCIEDYCPGESQCGFDDGRFGFSYEKGELKSAIDSLREIGVRLSGLHLHCSSKTRSLNIYRAIAEVALEVVETYKLNLDYIDIGGGFFGGVEGKPSFSDYFNTVKGVLDKSTSLADVRMVVEPGMSIIGASVDFVTEVVDVKETKNNRFVLLNGSRIHVDPLMRKHGYMYRIDRNTPSYIHGQMDQILCGFTCMEGDRFFSLRSEPLCVGDRVTFEKVGGYTMGLSPQFIEGYPAVLVEQDEELYEVRARQQLPLA